MPEKFIELDSNYRNRSMDPFPSDFTVMLSQTGMRGQINASDPITYSYPQIIFSPFGTISDLTYTVATVPGISACSSNTTFVVTSSTASTTLNYYLGAILLQTSNDPSGTMNQVRRITSWQYLTGTSYLVTIDSAFSNFNPASGTTTFSIIDPTSIVIPTASFFFIPTSYSIPDYYNTYLLYNQTRNSSANILSFDQITHLAQVSDITGKNWQLTDVYEICQDVPRISSTLITVSSTSLNTVNVGFPLDQSYINNFVRVYSTTNQTGGDIRRILSVEGDIATVSPFFSELITANNFYYQILPFSIDNVSPFVYSGTLVSQNQPTAQTLTLTSLILPNQTLSNGGRIAFYPYVYVEVKNISSPSRGAKNMIYSNNPNTYSAVFKVPITDLNHPTTTPFVKLTGAGMKQTIVFKPNDDMRVSVKLPNGDLFKTALQDSDPISQPGAPPNTMLQISFVFGIEKVLI